MEKYIAMLGKTRLFAGLGEDEIRAICGCLDASERRYEKGEYVLRRGDEPGAIMILAEGRLLIQSDDYWGKRSIVNSVEKGEMFGEAYAGSGAMVNDVAAVEPSVVLFFDVGRVLTVCPSGCAFHALTVRNLFLAVCEKNRALVSRLGIFSGRSIREKLMAYLSAEAARQGGAEIVLPFDRQQLADFLAVDRSAMSRELGKMRSEGLLSLQRRKIILHEKSI